MFRTPLFFRTYNSAVWPVCSCSDDMRYARKCRAIHTVQELVNSALRSAILRQMETRRAPPAMHAHVLDSLEQLGAADERSSVWAGEPFVSCASVPRCPSVYNPPRALPASTFSSLFPHSTRPGPCPFPRFLVSSVWLQRRPVHHAARSLFLHSACKRSLCALCHRQRGRGSTREARPSFGHFAFDANPPNAYGHPPADRQ